MNRAPTTFLLLLASAPSAFAQTWTLAVPGSTANLPAPRSWAAMAMEWTRNQTVLFGGWDGTTPTSPGSLADTWTYDAAANVWTQRQPAVSPVARDSHVMAYDVARNLSVMFGGWDTVGNELGDTWEWNGSNWSNVTPASVSPPARLGAAMAYDQARGKCVLWGGSNYTLLVDYSDTWEWDGSTWTQRTPAVSPPARSGHVMAYDLARNRTVMFGGWDANSTLLGDTWEFDGTNWTQNTSMPAPAPRLWSSMVYDVGRSRCVLFGGAGTTNDYNDTWEYNGSWTQVTTTGAPTIRDSQAMAFDVGQNAVVLFGGYDLTNDLDDTWE